jgi:hypothetical protein
VHFRMNRPTAEMRDFAQWLVARETKANKSSGTKAPLVFGAVVDKLRRPLIILAGAPVFRSLLSRALALAFDEVRSLRAVHVNTEGSLECPAGLAQLDKKEIANAEVVVIAHLLGLLLTFIGEALTLRLLQDVWPGAPVNDFNSSRKDSKREET